MSNAEFENAPLRSLLNDEEVMEELRNEAANLRETVAEAVGLGRREGLAGGVGAESAHARLEHLLAGREAATANFGEPEAIILAKGRPALLVQGGQWEDPSSAVIKQRVDSASAALLTAIPKVARVELVNHPSMEYVGTGWMIDEDIMITNRHVAGEFAFKRGDQIVLRTTPFGQPLIVRADFNEEYQSPNPPFEVSLEEVVFIENDGSDFPDMALIRLKRVDNLPPPIELSELRVERDDNVAVIGYPARDGGRNDPFVMHDIFKGIYDVKRLSPGRITGVREDRFVLTHDCTTLGGNSGSVVLNMRDGKAAGLHFAGSYRKNNFAVTSETIRERMAALSHRAIITMPSEAEIERVPTANELATRTGYDDGFLGSEVSLPEARGALAQEVAPVNGRNDGLLHYHHFTVVMHKSRRLAMFTACNIDGGKLYGIRRRRDRWALDPRIREEHQVGNELYRSNPLDRGHLVRRLDPAWGETRAEAREAVEDTFFYTNAMPQHSRLNQQTWLSLEEYILDNAATHDFKVNVFTGPVYSESDQEYRGILIPQEYWKVVTIVNTFTGALSATGYLLSQAAFVEDLEFVYGEFRTYQVPIVLLERKTGLAFGELTAHDPIGRIEGIGPRTITSPADLTL
jgi:endonuclease G